MSIHVTTWVQEYSNAELGERLVLLMLADNADEETLEAWPSVRNIAHRTRLSNRQVQRCLRSLQDAGRVSLVKAGSGAGHTSVYRIEKGCQYDTLYVAQEKGDKNGKGDILSRKGDICDTSILSEPSVEPSVIPPLPPQELANLASPPHSAQESHEPLKHTDPQVRPRVGDSPVIGASNQATGDDPGQNGADGPGRITASARGSDNLERGVQREAAICCIGNGTPLFEVVSAGTGVLGELSPLTPMQEYNERMRLVNQRQAVKRNRKAHQNRRYPPQSGGAVQRNGREVPLTATPSSESRKSPLIAKLRTWAEAAGCDPHGNGLPEWMVEELGAAYLRDEVGFEERARALLARAEKNSLDFGAALRAIHQAERELAKAPGKSKRVSEAEAENERIVQQLEARAQRRAAKR